MRKPAGPSVLALVVTAGLVACSFDRFSPGSTPGGAPSETALQSGHAGVHAGHAVTHFETQPGEGRPGGLESAQDLGTLLLIIRWPAEGQADRALTAIPASSRTIRLEVYDPSENRVAAQNFTRASGTSQTVAKIEVPASVNYRVSALAFAEEEPGSDAAPIARGDAVNVLIRKAKTTQVAITMTPTLSPAITTLSPGNGGVGRSVLIKGRNFGASKGLSFLVRFAGVQAKRADRQDDQTIETDVPSGAPSGNLTVVVDGIESVSTSPFAVIQYLRFDAFKGFFLTRATATLTFVAQNSDGSTIAAPSVDWSIDQPSIASITQSGFLASLGDDPATVTVRIESGLASASTAVPTWPRPLGVAISPQSWTINARYADGTADPGFVTSVPVKAVVTYSDGSTDSAVTWSSSDPRLGTYSAGKVVSAPDAPAGTLVLTATSDRDGRTKAQASFEVTTFGSAEVTVE